MLNKTLSLAKMIRNLSCVTTIGQQPPVARPKLHRLDPRLALLFPSHRLGWLLESTRPVIRRSSVLVYGHHPHGASVVPPNGFSSVPLIHFTHKEDDHYSHTPMFPIAKACVTTACIIQSVVGKLWLYERSMGLAEHEHKRFCIYLCLYFPFLASLPHLPFTLQISACVALKGQCGCT